MNAFDCNRISPDTLSHFRFLRFASFPQLSPEILSFGERRIVPPGTVLINFDEKISHLYYIHSGLVCGSRILGDGKEIFAVLLGRNNIFPDIFYYSGIKSESQMKTLRKTNVSVFNKDTLDKLINYPDFVNFIITSLAVKGVNSANRFVAMLNESRKDKILHLLFELAFYEGKKINEGFLIKFYHEELASILGMHRVTVSKILAELSKDNLIQCRRNNILILKKAFCE